ncbi:MAG: polysaccharide pyruvyl transferase family protein [Muribaculaceae bacterium]|nr:polysaccharide pyruvyl transferase family protein [Muribaculaceae bacterium]
MSNKKVGILTFHGAHNFGSVLQSYASVMTLRRLGYMAEIINLRNQAQLEAYKIFRKSDSIIHRLFKILIYPQLKSRSRKFEYFINKILPISKKEYRHGLELDAYQLGYDIYYAGSDQIWNPACQDFEPAYYLDFVKHQFPTISYAPSLGKGKFDQQDEDLIKGLLDNVDYLSCREISGANLIERLSGRKTTQVCDPVLLPPAEEWREFAKDPKRKKPYILVYFLENNHGDHTNLELLKQRTGYDVILLNEYLREYLNPNITLKLNASPQEFLGLIKDAEYIYTNSFHATAFSVIFNRPFSTAIAKSENVANNNDSRKVDFLKSLGLEDRLVKSVSDIDLNAPIDYRQVNKRVEEIRKKSLDYLNNSLNGK